jgi:hypothetical protein
MQETCYFQKVEGKPATSWGRARPRDVIINGQIGGPEVRSTTKDDYVYLYIPFLGESGKVLEKNYHSVEGDVINTDLERYTISDIDTIPSFLTGIPIGEEEINKIRSLYSGYTIVYGGYQKEKEELEKQRSSAESLSVRLSISGAKLSIKWSKKIYAAEKGLIDYTETLLSSLIQPE